MTNDPALRVGVARAAAVPDVHAAVARGCGVLRADDRQGRRAGRAHQVRSGRGSQDHRGAEDHGDDAGAVDDLRADGPSGFAHARPVVAGDRVLRRVGDEPGAAEGGDRPVRPDLRAVLRAVRGPDGHHLSAEGRSRREAADVVRAADGVLPDRPARRRRQPVPQGEVGEICGRGPLLSGGYWNKAGGDGRDVPRRLDAHRRPGPRGRGRLLVHRRPHQGHDRHRRLQRVPA